MYCSRVLVSLHLAVIERIINPPNEANNHALAMITNRKELDPVKDEELIAELEDELMYAEVEDNSRMEYLGHEHDN